MLLAGKLAIGGLSIVSTTGIAFGVTKAFVNFSKSTDGYNFENPSSDNKIISIYESKNSEEIKMLKTFIANDLSNMKNMLHIPTRNFELTNVDKLQICYLISPQDANNIFVWMLGFKNGVNIGDNNNYFLFENFKFNDLKKYVVSNAMRDTYKVAPLFVNNKLTFGIFGRHNSYSVDWEMTSFEPIEQIDRKFNEGHANFVIEVS